MCAVRDDDDIWADDDENDNYHGNSGIGGIGGSGSTSLERQAFQVAQQREFTHLRQTLYHKGYVEGLEVAKDRSVAEGFQEGFTTACDLAYYLGQALGYAELAYSAGTTTQMRKSTPSLASSSTATVHLCDSLDFLRQYQDPESISRRTQLVQQALRARWRRKQQLPHSDDEDSTAAAAEAAAEVVTESVELLRQAVENFSLEQEQANKPSKYSEITTKSENSPSTAAGGGGGGAGATLREIVDEAVNAVIVSKGILISLPTL